MSKFCSVCGAALEEGAGFCGNCGANNAPGAPDAMTGPVLSPQPAPQPAQQQPAPFQPIRQPRPQARVARPINADNQQFQVATPNTPGAEEKSRMGLGIGVTVAIVLGIAALITAAVLTIFVWKPWESSADGPESVIEKFNEYDMGKISETELLSVYYEYRFASDSAKAEKIHSILVWPAEETVQWFKDNYGDDYTLKSTIRSQVPVEGAERQELLDYVKQYADTSKIDEIVRVYGTTKAEGSRGSDTTEFFEGDGIIFIKADGKWYASSFQQEKMRSAN